jgi:hypothetical protein
MASAFTPLERAVLASVCEVYPEDRAALETQLATASLRSRENNGHGFYRRFTVDHASSTQIRGARLRNGPAAKIDGLEHGMGFDLWLKEGYADCLEGFGYGENPAAINLETVSFEISLLSGANQVRKP